MRERKGEKRKGGWAHRKTHPRQEMQSFSNLISELTSHDFIHILFARVESLSLFHIQWKEFKNLLLRGGLSKKLWA